MKRDRLWLYITFAVAAVLLLITLLTTDGDPAKVYGDPDVFNSMIPFIPYKLQSILATPLGIIMCLMIAGHAWLTLGKKPTISMLAVALGIGFVGEEIGMRTGLVFGPYYHTSIQGIKIDATPVLVMCLWVVCLYIGWALANLLLDGTPTPTKKHTVPQILVGAFLGAMVTTTMDLGADPFAAANGWWVWINGGSFAGVPVHNFVGWMTLGIITLVIHGFDFNQQEVLNIAEAPRWKKIISVIPVAVYGCMWVMFTLLNMEGYVGLVTFFAIGIPFVIAMRNWVNWYKTVK